MKPKNFDDLVQELTEDICRLMEAQEVSRSELARRLGTSPAYVTKILRGNANFTLTSLVKLCRALNAELRVELLPRKSSDSKTRTPKNSKKSSVATGGSDFGGVRMVAQTAY